MIKCRTGQMISLKREGLNTAKEIKKLERKKRLKIIRLNDAKIILMIKNYLKCKRAGSSTLDLTLDSTLDKIVCMYALKLHQLSLLRFCCDQCCFKMSVYKPLLYLILTLKKAPVDPDSTHPYLILVCLA